MSENVRSAGVRKEERLAAGSSSAEIVARAKEIGSTYRVYVKEWLWDGRFDTHKEAEKALAKYEGRLRAEDMKVLEDWDGTFLAMSRRWNVHSEWKYAEMASGVRDNVAVVAAEGDEVEVVVRNSRREHVLSQYGVLRMAGA